MIPERVELPRAIPPDVDGATSAAPAAAAGDARGSALAEMLHGYRATCVLLAAVELGVIEHLRNAPCTTDELARATGTQPDALARLLRALHGMGVVAIDDAGVALAAEGRALLPGASSLHDQAVLTQREYLPVWARLARSVARGEPAAHELFAGSTWAHRAADAQANASFNRLMAAGQRATAAALLRSIDFSAFATIVDVGGGTGDLLIELLRELPQASGISFDLPQVTPAAGQALREAGLSDRCAALAGSFFDGVPAAADAYVLQHVLHDWDDARALAILRRCRSAMTARSTLLVIEHLLPDAGSAPIELALLDLHMLLMHGGRERTRAQYEALLRDAGLEPAACHPLPGTRCVLLATPRA